MMLDEAMGVDVAVCGSGVAGLRAALAAAEAGATVAVIAGGTPNSIGISGVNTASGDDGPDRLAAFVDETVESSGGLAVPELVSAMAQDSLVATEEIRQLGVPLVLDDRGRPALRLAIGSRLPRTMYCERLIGMELLRALFRAAKRNERIRWVRGWAVAIADRGGTAGGVVVAGGDGPPFVIKSRAVVLATGGAGNVYRETTNRKGALGLGYYLGWEAGADLVDMEFVCFEPLIVVYPPKQRGIPVPTPLLAAEGAVLRNNRGEVIVDPSQHPTKAVISRIMHAEITQGRAGPHGGMFLDVSGVSDEVLVRYFRMRPALWRAFGDDRKCEVAPAQHYMDGGLRIDERCQTTLPGLFAAGEVAGGVHGAYRLAGSSSIDALVFGARAGRNAAQFASVVPSHSRVAVEWHKGSGRNGRIGIPPEADTALREIKGIMSTHVGIVRRGDGLLQAVTRLREMQEEVEHLAQAVPHILTRKTVKAAWFVAYVIAKAALAREESRGDHFRSDYPDQDDHNWRKHIVIRRRGSEVVTSVVA